MRSRSLRCWLILWGLILEGCGQGVATRASPLNEGSPFFTSAARLAGPPTLSRRNSWLAPDLKKVSKLLFVSDAGTREVYLYRLPSLKLAGRVTGFSQPQGECSDNRGNVWVTDTNAQTVYELSHSGHLIGTLLDKTGYPDACAWDPSTGNLAVMNIFDLASTAGSVIVYPGGSGSPATYANPSQYFYNFGGYDNKGNLFFDGRGADGTFMLSELTKRGSVKTVEITGGTIYYPGMVQWVGSRLEVGDQSCDNANSSCIYQISVTSTFGTIERTTYLAGPSGEQICELAQGVVIRGREIAGSDNDFCGYAPSGTYVWKYPAGGNPVSGSSHADSVPVGATVSAVQQ